MSKLPLFRALMRFASVTIFGALTVTNTVHAGGVNGGGGKGVFCPGEHLKLLDLYEAELRGHKLPEPTGDTDTEVDRFFLRFLKHFSTGPVSEDVSKSAVQAFKDLINGKNLDTTSFRLIWERNLPVTKDATLPKLKPGCKFVQIGINRKSEVKGDEKSNSITEFVFDPDYWEQLDSLQRIAAFFHEFSYSRERDGYDLTDADRAQMTSDETRFVVGQLITNQTLPSIVPNLENVKQKVWCGFGGGKVHGGNEEHFEIYAKEESVLNRDGIGLYFYGFKERLVTSRTSAFIPGVRIKHLLAGNIPMDLHLTVLVKNPVLNKKWLLKLGSDVYGLTLRAWDTQAPATQIPHVSGGFCKLED